MWSSGNDRMKRHLKGWSNAPPPDLKIAEAFEGSADGCPGHRGSGMGAELLFWAVAQLEADDPLVVADRLVKGLALLGRDEPAAKPGFLRGGNAGSPSS
jgi:hypothetical protein